MSTKLLYCEIKSLEDAVAFLRYCADIHRQWVDYLTNYPNESKEAEPIVDVAGDSDHHSAYIARYTEAISLIMQSGA